MWNKWMRMLPIPGPPPGAGQRQRTVKSRASSRPSLCTAHLLSHCPAGRHRPVTFANFPPPRTPHPSSPFTRLLYSHGIPHERASSKAPTLPTRTASSERWTDAGGSVASAESTSRIARTIVASAERKTLTREGSGEMSGWPKRVGQSVEQWAWGACAVYLCVPYVLVLRA